MTDKIVITSEQVVTRKGGYISYYDEGSTLRKAKIDTVLVLEPGAKPPEKAVETPQPSSVPDAQADQPVATEAKFDVDIPPSDPPPAASEKPTKPSKRGTKPKEESDMATKTATKKKAPKKGKAAAKPRDVKPGGSKQRTIGGKPVDISRYAKAKAPGGGTSYHNNDAVAQKLEGKDLDQVYEIVAKALKVEVRELKGKYKSLNVGMQRMNLGNRLRKATMPKKEAAK